MQAPSTPRKLALAGSEVGVRQVVGPCDAGHTVGPGRRDDATGGAAGAAQRRDGEALEMCKRSERHTRSRHEIAVAHRSRLDPAEQRSPVRCDCGAESPVGLVHRRPGTAAGEADDEAAAKARARRARDRDRLREGTAGEARDGAHASTLVGVIGSPRDECRAVIPNSGSRLAMEGRRPVDGDGG